ncbi:MAG TPA: heme-binding domain-containing protein [Cytophagaceae bacterium]|jgi:hypothetical protein|nr:heme-binding domain-containing protein [Cytophagaceae bacterium]
MKKKIIIGIVSGLLLIQLFRIDKKNPPIQNGMDFLTITNAPIKIGTIIKTSCYDCHSNETSYPWYTNVAPISWWTKHHINEGRHELNFSEWGKYNTKRVNHKLDKCIELVEEGEMPMSSYTLIHKNAALNEEQKRLLIEWFGTLRNSDKATL